VLTASQEAEIAAAEEMLRALHLDPIPERYLLARVYAAAQLWHAAIQTLEAVVRTTEAVASEVQIELGTLYLRVGLARRAEAYYRTAQRATDDAHVQAVATFGLAAVHWRCGEVSQARSRLRALATDGPDAVVARLADHLLAQMDLISKPEPALKGEITRADYVRFLSEQVAPHLTSAIRKIPALFLEQLEALEHLRLRPTTAWSPAHLGEEPLAALEIVAATHLTTQALLDSLTVEDLGTPPSDLDALIRTQAERVARQTVGLPASRAESFARRYAASTMRRLPQLRALLGERP
jgi:tetratricopeptide (TPR) repeat protein